MDQFNSSEGFAKELIAHFEKKANHNKSESLVSFVLIIGCGLFSSLFITLGEGVVFGKIVPSILSLITTGLTAWVQLRKPQLLWSLYRDSQRKMEDVLYKYWFNLEEFSGISQVEKERVLVNEIRKINLTAHSGWVNLVPSPEGNK